MNAKRIIVCLDVRDGKVTKGVKFKDNADIGDPVEMARDYQKHGVDELVFYDITASVENRSPITPLVEAVGKQVNIPYTVGGGISSIAKIRELIDAGADKVSINSPAVKNPELISEAAAIFGKDAIILGMDVLKDKAMPSGYRVMIDGGRVSTELDAVEWAQKGVELGAGEIVLNSVDADGTKEGYDCEITRKVAEAVTVPVIASGGAGKLEHLAEVLTEGKADAALVASIAHYGDFSIEEMKNYLKQNGIAVK